MKTITTKDILRTETLIENAIAIINKQKKYNYKLELQKPHSYELDQDNCWDVFIVDNKGHSVIFSSIAGGEVGMMVETTKTEFDVIQWISDSLWDQDPNEEIKENNKKYELNTKLLKQRHWKTKKLSTRIYNSDHDNKYNYPKITKV